MIPISSIARIWIATGYTDMRKGMQGLSLLVQESLGRVPRGEQGGSGASTKMRGLRWARDAGRA